MSIVKCLIRNNLNQIVTKSLRTRQNEIQDFKNIFQRLIDELTNRIQLQPMNNLLFRINDDPLIDDTYQWLRHLMEYNVLFGKLNRGLSLTINYQILASCKSIPEIYKTLEYKENSRILGWCVEMFQTYFLILDDIMDNSITRRGRPCWYRKENVGMMACNDATLVESSIFYLMDRHLREHPCYPQLVQLMHEGFRITGHGQCLDILTEKKAKLSEIGCNLSVYEMDRYRTIVKYKTSFYTFVMPTRMAMYLANRIDEREHQQVESIMTKIGELFQVQDDYIDCYGDPQVIGKIGTDIRDGKCSWLVVNALLNCNELQRSIIQMNYGQDNEKQESIIKNLYRELDMTESFQQYETRMIESIIDEINQLELNQLPVEIFYEPLSHVYHRKK